MTNQEIRGVSGSRGMGRVNTLIHMGYPITVRKLKGSLWEVRYKAPALGRDPRVPTSQRRLF